MVLHLQHISIWLRSLVINMIYGLVDRHCGKSHLFDATLHIKVWFRGRAIFSINSLSRNCRQQNPMSGTPNLILAVYVLRSTTSTTDTTYGFDFSGDTK